MAAIAPLDEEPGSSKHGSLISFGLTPEESPDIRTDEVRVAGMWSECEAWVSAVLLPRETLVKHVAGYHPARVRLNCCDYLLIVPLLLHLLWWVSSHLNCCCSRRRILNDRVMVAVTSRRRILYWHHHQSGHRAAPFFCCQRGNRTVTTDTDVAVFQLDDLAAAEVGFQAGSCCGCTLPVCRRQHCAQLALHFGMPTRHEVRMPTPQLTYLGFNAANEWDTFPMASGLLHRALFHTLNMVQMILRTWSSLRESCPTLLIAFDEGVIRSDAVSSLAQLLALEASLLRLEPAVMKPRVSATLQPCSAHFAMVGSSSNAKLFEASQPLSVSINPEQLVLMRDEILLDAHAVQRYMSLWQWFWSVVTLGLYYWLVIRPQFCNKSALLTTSHRIIELHTSGPAVLQPDDYNCLFVKRWFALGNSRSIVVAARGRSVEVSVLSTSVALKFLLHAPEPWWRCASFSAGKRQRLFDFAAQLQADELPTASIDPAMVLQQPDVQTAMLPSWQQASVRFLPGETVVAMVRSSPRRCTCCSCCKLLCSFGFRPYLFDQMFMLTNKRFIAFKNAYNRPFVCCCWRDVATMALSVPISELRGSHLHGRHYYTEDCVRCCCCTPNYTALASHPHMFGGFPINLNMRRTMAVAGPGCLEEDDVTGFMVRAGVLIDSMHGPEAVHDAPEAVTKVPFCSLYHPASMFV